MSKKLSRRNAIVSAAGLAAAARLGTVGAQDATPGASPAAGDDILESSVEGVPDAILQAPEPFTSYEGMPANGGTVRYTHLIYGAPATGHDDNTYWQELETHLGVESFEVQEIPVAAYEEKVSALLAGGDLGDLFYLNTAEGGAAVINQAIDQGAFTDLTEELTGDNLQKYPNLAALPADMWTQSMVNGKIFGVPNPIYQGSNMTFYRKDWADTLGLEAPQNAEEHLAFFTAFRENDPDGNGSKDTYGMAWNSANFISPMFRVPNGWRLNDDGSLTNAIETEEWIRQVEFRRQLWEAETIHPDAATLTQQQMHDVFNAGQTGIMSEGFGTWWGAGGTKVQVKETQPDAELTAFLPVGYDGGEAITYPLPAYYGIVGIPASVGGDSERMQELLRVCDYLYPPFGSEEYNFQQYGIEGTHHEIDADGARTLTTQGEADISGLIYGFSVADLYIYHPGYPDHAEERQEIVEITKPLNVFNPVVGLYSAVNAEKGPAITTYVNDTANDVIYGRKDVEELTAMQEEWRSRGGDEIRAEYEELLAQQNGG